MHVPPRAALRAFAAALFLCAAAAHAQILQNGSFENDYSGWTASGHQGIATNDPNHPATDGTKVVVLNPNDQNTNALLSQTFPTVPGQRYELSFDYGCVGPISDQHLEVMLEGNGVLLDNTIIISGPYPQPFYVPQHITFIANSLSTKLTFLDGSYTYVFLDSMLDNIQVNPVSANAPLITAQPQSTYAPQGNNAVFNVTASGATFYQWQFDGVNISGANSSTYTVTNADLSKAGNYSVIVTNATTSVSSSAATLTVVPAGILLNGSFEYGSAGWTYSGSNVSTSTNTAYGVTDGANLSHFNWGQQPANGNMFQTFNTIPGETYVVDFDLGGFSLVNHDEQRCRVSVTDGSNATLVTHDFSVFAPANGGSYTPEEITFVATGSTATLTFLDISPGTTNVDMLLDNVRVRLQNAPLITTQPSNQTVVVGDPVTFNVTAVGQAPLHYQWRFNNGGSWTPVGGDSSTFSIPSAQTSDQGLYDVIVTNGAGNITSSSASLTVFVPGVFANGSFESDYAAWTATGNQAVVAAGNGFTVTDGTKAVAFNVSQKPANGVLSQTFTTTVGQAYILTFDAGAVSSVNQDEQRLQVTLQGQGQANPALSQTVSVFAPGNGVRYVAQQFVFIADSTNTTLTFRDVSPTTFNVDLLLDHVQLAVQPPPGPFTNGSFESDYSGWGFSGSQAIASGAPYVATDGSKAVAFNVAQQTPSGVLVQTFATTSGHTYNLAFDVGAISFSNQAQQRLQVTVLGPNNAPVLGPQIVTVNAPGNGTTYASQNLMFVATGASATLMFQDVSTTSQNVDLVLDNVRVSDQATIGPVISAQPQDQTASAGTGATFMVTATGQGVVKYQWRYNNGTSWNDINGATGATFTINAVQNSDAGSYDVVVSDDSGQPSVTSATAVLTVTTMGALANGSFESDYTSWTHSGSQAVVTGSPYVPTDGAKAVAFNVGQQTPSGVLSQTFATANGHTYNLTFDVGAISFVNQSQQRLQVSVLGPNNTTLFGPQIVSVNAPGNGTLYVPQSFMFVANGATATLVFQDVSTTSQNVDLVLDHVQVGDQNTAGPSITMQPQNQTAQAGGSVTFNVTATGQGTVGYQWRYNDGTNWNNIAGANAASFTINPVQNSDAGSYDVIVSDQSGQPAVTSSAATLSVVPAGVPANGSFEFDYAGWTPTGSQAIVSGAPYSVTDGAKAVAFNVGQQAPSGTLSQSISITPGQNYTLTFDVGAISFSNTSQQRLQVSVVSPSGTLVAPQIVSVNAPGNGTHFVAQNFAFIANDTTATITFQDVSQTSFNVDLVLDNVRVTAQAPAASLTNGSFESGYTGWTPAGNQGLVNGAPFVATDGTQAVVFNAGQQTPNGTLSQSFQTTATTTYSLKFDAGAISTSNHNEQRFQVTVTGNNNSVLLSQSVSVFAPGNGTTYVPQTFSFVADGSAAILTFQDTSPTTQDVDLMLDHVEVTAQPGP